MSTSKTIVIGIPTFRRPQGLRRLLRSISQQQAPFTPLILVADNDGLDGAGIKVVEEMNRQGFPFEIRGIAVPERGLSHVRNALFMTAFRDMIADVLIMVDDDERVVHDWAVGLLNMQIQTGVDVVAGPVFAEFENRPPKWVHGQSLYWGTVLPAGAIDMISGTGNVLFSRTVFTNFEAPLFDARFSLTGGEDKEYFLRIKNLGARFAFAPDARSYELVGASRMTRLWSLQRAYRMGNADMRIFKLQKNGACAWAQELFKIPIAIATATVAALVLLLSSARHMRAMLTIARQVGKISALIGYHRLTYKTIHGK